MTTTAPAPALDLHIRWMIRRDRPAVMLIEGSAPDPWTDADFETVLKQRNCLAYVAEVAGAIVGYSVHEIHKGGLEFLNLAVHPFYRRCGVAGALVRKVLTKAAEFRRPVVSAWVREGNLGGQLFWRACGFRVMRVERSHFDGEDGYRFEREVQS